MAAPTDITGLVHRFRASQVTGYTNGASVSSAAFETGGITLSQATGANQPTYITSSINGLAGLRFNGTTSSIAGTITTAVTQSLTISLVLHLADASAAQEILYSGIELLMNGPNPGKYEVYAGSSTLSGGTTATGNHVITLVANSGGSAVLYVDGTQVLSGVSGSGALDQYMLGKHATLSRYLNGDICEIVTYNKALSGSELITLNTYMQNTYGIGMAGVNASTSRFIRNVDLTSLLLANSGFMQANVQTANYTLAKTDVGSAVEMNVGSANTLTVPTNASVGIAVGSVVNVFQAGTGATTITPASGVTLRAPLGTTLNSQYASAILRQRSTDEWVVSGNTKTVAAIVQPSSISNLAAWFKTDVGVTLNGSTVSAWADQSSNANNVAQATVAAQPTFGVSSANGLSLIGFNGSSMYLSGTTNTGITGNAFTIFVVYSISSTASPQSFTAFGATTNSRQFRYMSTYQYLTNTGSTDVGSGTTVVPTSTLRIGALRYTGSNLQFYVNGSTDGGVSTLTTSFSSTSNGIVLGAQPNRRVWTGADRCRDVTGQSVSRQSL
jgi:hypothetical protein